MKYIWLIGLLATTVVLADTRFLPLPQDFPIMDGLKIQKSKETIFSNAEGRVMIYVANTDASPNVVENFYSTTLKNLGWKSLTQIPNVFTRHLEQVELRFEPISNATQVTFTFKPCS